MHLIEAFSYFTCVVLFPTYYYLPTEQSYQYEGAPQAHHPVPIQPLLVVLNWIMRVI